MDKMRTIKKFLFIFLFTGLFLLINNLEVNAGYQRFNNLNFEAYLNNDGSMSVTEIWDITISETNTIFKSFEKDNKKYTGISNVKVTDITNGEKKLRQIFNEMYHVTKDCYYALNVKNNRFEIAWGVGLDDEKATRRYKVEYTVEDAVSTHNDCAQLYWQFMGADNEIEAKKIIGTIHLPTKANSKEEIRVWGHTEGLNGEINVTDLDKVEFKVDELEKRTYVEVRVVMPKEMIQYSRRTYYTDAIDSILKEEQEWANEANRKRAMKKIFEILICILAFSASIGIIVILIVKIKKYSNQIKQMPEQLIPMQEMKYFREIPRETASPSEAQLLSQKNKFSFIHTELGNIFSAILMNLYNEDYIEIKEDKGNKNNTTFILKASENQIQNIKNNDEKEVYNYMAQVAKGSSQLTLKELQKYITKYPSKIEKLQKAIEKETKQKLYDINYINKEKEKEVANISGIQGGYIVVAFLSLCFGLPIVAALENIILVPFIIAIFVLSIVCCNKLSNIAKRVNVYSQKAIDEIEMWKGLKKFMEELSQIDKKEIPEIVLWEKYLVYATAFGIADKVIKQLRMIYPDFDSQLEMYSSTHLYLMLHSNIGNTISTSVSRSISSAYSSGSGGGGGFSGGGGGGGGRRRLRRKIRKNYRKYEKTMENKKKLKLF